MEISGHSHPAQIFVAVDGGGSTTRALIAGDNGSVWGLGTARGCNPHERGTGEAIAELQNAIADAWLNANIVPQPFAGGFFGIAGSSSLSAEQRHALTAWVPRLPNALVQVDHDIRIALAGGLSGRPGIAVIAGTGSSGYGRNAIGRTAQAGGWGSLLDDAGGGYWLARRALSAIARASDGRTAPTLLKEGILQSLNLSNERDILEWLRLPNIGRPEIAGLAPTLFEAAGEGDIIALNIVQEGARELVTIAEAIARRLFITQLAEVVFTGGLSQEPQYSQAFRTALDLSASKFLWVQSVHSPLVGALSLAAYHAGFNPPTEWLKEADAQIGYKGSSKPPPR